MIHTYARMRVFHIPMHIAFLLLAHAFAHVLVSPAINFPAIQYIYDPHTVLYTLGLYTGIAMLPMSA